MGLYAVDLEMKGVANSFNGLASVIKRSTAELYVSTIYKFKHASFPIDKRECPR